MTEATPACHRVRRVAPLALVVLLATACGDDDKGTAPPTNPPSATTISTQTTPAPPTGGGAPEAPGKGRLVMGKRNLIPLLGGSIRQFAPTQVEGRSLHVVALAGPGSFWAGRSRSRRILVSLRLKGGDAPKITVGQEVDFIGLITASAADAGALGVRNDADKTLLEKHGAYVNASAADVKLR